MAGDGVPAGVPVHSHSSQSLRLSSWSLSDRVLLSRGMGHLNMETAMSTKITSSL